MWSRSYSGEDSFELEALAGEHYVYVDITWKGLPVPAAQLNKWLVTNVEEAIGGLTLTEILERHRTDVWSLAVEGERRVSGYRCRRRPDHTTAVGSPYLRDRNSTTLSSCTVRDFPTCGAIRRLKH